ncbi:hypothetical protein [Phyllobacterium sp. UNC302MFCol5.2]|uniref:hypothetical protein n=1 Tax=Phyllobacterium sp. UNC302MFCol5.2 TaxID=1449065 RepID=UPI000485642C|nr:hypothetical protein [Phyllobacterium sp. UNC302MFCol5.2]
MPKIRYRQQKAKKIERIRQWREENPERRRAYQDRKRLALTSSSESKSKSIGCDANTRGIDDGGR